MDWTMDRAMRDIREAAAAAGGVAVGRGREGYPDRVVLTVGYGDRSRDVCEFSVDPAGYACTYAHDGWADDVLFGVGMRPDDAGCLDGDVALLARGIAAAVRKLRAEAEKAGA